MSSGRPPVRIFRDQLEGESLDQFSVRKVAMTSKENNTLRGEVDEFVRFLQNNFNTRPALSVAKVIKAGSLGKGTAVRDSADIDLVIFLNGPKTIQELIDLRKPVLKHLRQDVERYPPWQGRLTFKKETGFSVSYYLGEHEVDLLPAFAIHPTEYTRNRDAMYREMETMRPKGRGFIAQQYSASLSPIQIECVQSQDEDVKKVIRLLKKWKKENELHDVKSYTLEMVTIYTSREADGFRHGRIRTDDLFQKVLEKLRGCRSMKAYLKDNYTLETVNYRNEFTTSPPYVLDVANYYNNLLHRTDLDRLSQAAAATLALLGR